VFKMMARLCSPGATNQKETNMKNYKTSLHIMLSVASLLGFLGGWATLAHSRKPIQNTNSSSTAAQGLEPLPDLAPLPALDGSSASANNNDGNVITFSQQAQPSRLRQRPFFTTSGS
jgi:hypothetical protein